MYSWNCQFKQVSNRGNIKQRDCLSHNETVWLDGYLEFIMWKPLRVPHSFIVISQFIQKLLEAPTCGITEKRAKFKIGQKMR